MTTDQLPEPLTPSEADLKDFPYTPIFRARLFGSAFHARANDAEWRAGITLWLKAQDQRPAGSLPDDDVELCRLAELGRDLKGWKRMRAGALHGWRKCSDGRLYNQVVAEVVNAQWQEKIDQRSRTMKARIAALEKRLKDAKDQSVKDEITTQLQKLRHDLSQVAETAKARPVTKPVTVSVTETKRREEKEREGKGSTKKESTHTPSLDPAPPALDPPNGGVGFDPRFSEVAARASEILNNPNVLVWNRVEQWLKSGADPEMDIYPTLRSAKTEWRSNNLEFFDWRIAIAKASRSKPMPEGKASRQRNGGEVPLATQSQTEIDEVERINAQFIAGGSYQSDVSLTQVKVMIEKGLLTPDQARKAGYAA